MKKRRFPGREAAFCLLGCVFAGGLNAFPWLGKVPP